MTAEIFEAGRGRIHLLGVIKGLTSETMKVQEAFESAKPDKVAISLSKEEVEGLRNLPEDYVPQLSRYEEIYAEGLGRFGNVAAPPPCYIAALEIADRMQVPVVPVDLDEASYTELYCTVVSGSTLFRHSTRTWLLKLRKFGAKTPEEFVLAWDRAVNRLGGLRTIEEKRAESMAKGILESASGARSLLAVVELERARDVSRILSSRLS